MDPIDSILADTQDPQAQKKQATIKEMQRRAQDRILVHNITSEDYTVYFDSIGFLVPSNEKDNGHGKGNAVVLRYVALNFLTQMINLVLTGKLDDAVKAENDRRASLGMLPMTKFIGGEELAFTQGLRTDNEEARRKLTPLIWLGIAERYGNQSTGISQSGQPKDDRPMDERLLDNLEKQAPNQAETAVITEDTATSVVSNETPENEAISALKDKDVFTLRKIAREKGIELEKTAKKEEIIAKLSQ